MGLCVKRDNSPFVALIGESDLMKKLTLVNPKEAGDLRPFMRPNVQVYGRGSKMQMRG
jgi:hypothetical protein